jgi:hypothetical protein
MANEMAVESRESCEKYQGGSSSGYALILFVHPLNLAPSTIFLQRTIPQNATQRSRNELTISSLGVMLGFAFADGEPL